MKEGDITALFHGYYFTMKKEKREWRVNIRRDLSDPIVGLESKHQQMLRAADYKRRDEAQLTAEGSSFPTTETSAIEF